MRELLPEPSRTEVAPEGSILSFPTVHLQSGCEHQSRAHLSIFWKVICSAMLSLYELNSEDVPLHFLSVPPGTELIVSIPTTLL